MTNLQSSLLIFSALLCLTLGWEPGTQYEYKYIGRSIAGIYKLKQQNAVIELQSRVTVQSTDENTIVVKLSDSRLKRNGNFVKVPYLSGFEGPVQEDIEGEEERIASSEVLSVPFSITHNKGSITGVEIGSDEPEWIVNFKKSVASQLQLDITGVRRDGPAINWSVPKDGESATFSVYEDSVTGDCSTTIAISQLPSSQIVSSGAQKLKSFGDVCSGKPVYQIVKTKDFSNCKKSPVWHSTTSEVYTCDFDKANCGEFLKRTSLFKYVACGEDFSKLTVVQVQGFSDLLAQPFAVKSEELVNSVVTSWTLEKKERIGSRLTLSPSLKEHRSLSYSHEIFNQVDQDGVPVKPNLSGAYFKSPVPISTLQKNILNSLRAIERDLKERPDSEKDNLERLAVIARSLHMFSLDELRSLWQDVKSQSLIIQTLFVDCVAVSGTNPAVMLIKELIETEFLTGHKANFALSALGYYVKTPTHELLHELVNLMKSSHVQSFKSTYQIAMTTVADLVNKACGSRSTASKRFPVSVMGDFCDSHDSVIVHELLPLLVRELETNENVFDRIVALSAFGSLGIEEIVPILLPIIRGTPGRFDDTAERVRAILSLQRVVFTVPEKIHPMLTSLATNVGERPEVRMASIAMLLLSNATQPVYTKLAASTWFEPSRQVHSFVSSLISSLAVIPSSTPLFEQLSQKAKIALPNLKASPFGIPFSMADIRSSHLDEGISVLMYTITHRDSDQSFPVYLSNAYYYQLGPLNREPFTITMWNYNMADVYQNVFAKIYRGVNAKYDAPWAERKDGDKNGILKGIWDELKASAKPADKRAGFVHISLLDSINRFINFEDLDEMIPNFMAENMKSNQPSDISITKYRMLGEYNIHFATDLGLPMQYLFTLPMLVSAQGTFSCDGAAVACKSVIAAELSWKMTAEIRVDIPFSGNYVSTGVDVLVDFHLPKEFQYSYAKEDFKITWVPDNKVTDLIYYHVKPYTVSRSGSDSVKPTLEDPAFNLISVTDKPIQRELPLGDLFGVNLRLIEQSELAHSDKLSLAQYLAKWDINSIANMGFTPLDVRARKYILRYNPSGTKSRSISSAYFYQYAAKTNKNTLVYETGSSSPRKPSAAEVVSYKPIVSEFRPLLGRVFENLESGNARLMRASVTSEQKDGTLINLQSVVAMAMNSRYTKDITDWQVEYSTNAPNADKKVKYAICYVAVRNWNNPPTYGFSKDVLKMTEEDTIGFGPKCEHKVKFTAKLSRDEEAAKVAISSAAGQQCLKDMESGFKHGSPACTEARILDHTYNNYEMLSETENMYDSWLQWARSTTTMTNQIFAPFIVKHTHAQTNTPGRASWTIKRDPITGDSDMTFVRPHETVVMKNVRYGTEWARFSPLTFAYAQPYYPLTASSNFILRSLNLTSGGVSEAKCYVGSDAVYTFDGAHYKYAVDGCQHVLLTDCHQKSELAILAKQGESGQKIVTVIYGKDTFELDPNGYAIVNGVKTAFKDLEKGNHIEIRSPGAKSIKAVVFPLADGGVILDIRSVQFFLKVQGSHVELSAPVHLRGRTCGLCGDFNQEVEGEFKTADRCALSSGELMAASFKLKTSEGCSSRNTDIERNLIRETETCQSADQQFNTYLADYDL